MSDFDPIDRERALEADRQRFMHSSKSVPEIAAMLTRTGWTPPDPLQAEVEKIEFGMCADLFVVRDVIRVALQRGIAIGRGEPR